MRLLKKVDPEVLIFLWVYLMMTSVYAALPWVLKGKSIFVFVLGFLLHQQSDWEPWYLRGLPPVYFSSQRHLRLHMWGTVARIITTRKWHNRPACMARFLCTKFVFLFLFLTLVAKLPTSRSFQIAEGEKSDETA